MPDLHNWVSIQLLDLDVRMQNVSSRISRAMSNTRNLTLVKPRLEFGTLKLLKNFTSLSELHLYQPHTLLSPIEICGSLQYAPAIETLTLHLAPSPSDSIARATELLPLVYSASSSTQDVRRALPILWNSCPSLLHINLSAAMIDVEELLLSLPQTIKTVVVSHFGRTEADSVLRAVKERNLRSRRGKSDFRLMRLYVRHGWVEEAVRTVKEAFQEIGVVSVIFTYLDGFPFSDDLNAFRRLIGVVDGSQSNPLELY